MENNEMRSNYDLDKYRLRSFIDKLIELDEVEIHEEAVCLSDISRIFEATSKAVLLKNTGPEHLELVGNVMGKRSRIAAAFNTTERELVNVFEERLGSIQPIVEVDSDNAPVHEIILKGEEVDLTRLPFHPQHQFDGGTYLSSGIDYSIDPETGRTNVGCRRLSLRNRYEAGTNVTAPSDLRNIFQASVERGERLNVNFAVGSHPIDFCAAGMRVPTDEVTLISTLRGEPVPMVKGITNEIKVPADAEIIIEGYLDERGYCEHEGPFGEYMGYYGPMHMDPIYHVTAITMRHDALHQSLLHGCGRILHRAESANLAALVFESKVRGILRSIGIEPVDVCAKPSSGECQHLRVSIKKTGPGQARKVFSALFGSLVTFKHIFVMDEDIDVFSDEQFEWAFGTRFQADKDMMIFSKMQGFPMDPSLGGQRLGTKAGFDMTIPFGQKENFSWRTCVAPEMVGKAQYKTVRQALESGPMFFVAIMDSVGSKDGREIALELDDLRAKGELIRLQNGEYALKDLSETIESLTD